MDLSQQDWKTKLAADANAFILDVRTEEECNDGIIPGATCIDIYKGQEFVNQIDALDKSKNYYVYCRSGGRSGQACNMMSQMGFQNSYNLMGGFMKWEGDVDHSTK